MLSRRDCTVTSSGHPPVALFDLAAHGVAPCIVGTLGAAFEQRMTDVESSLSRSDGKLIDELASQIEKQVLTVLDSRTVAEFEKLRDIAWPKYVRALRALSDTMRNFVPDEEFNALSDKAIELFTGDFEKFRGKQFTDEMVNQAQFTLWTLRRLMALGLAIDASGRPPDEDSRGVDSRLHKDYRLYSLWAQFHLDITLKAMHFHKKIIAAIQHEICNGMRAAVNAYAIGEEALALRVQDTPEMQPDVVNVWDAEDEELLASSMRDLDASGDL
jgi:hypothetical protein